MIVAKYLDSFTLIVPISPVNRIAQVTPQGRDTNRSKKENTSKKNTNSFAAILHSSINLLAPSETDVPYEDVLLGSHFDSRA